ncbi:hypothetical protein N9878_00555 [bacterium]|nr:hypothetical protein [bacterium]
MLGSKLLMAAAGFVQPAAIRTYIGSTVSTADATVYTFSSHALGDAAADRKIVIGVIHGNAAQTVSTLTVGGSSATAIENVNNSGSGCAMYYIDLTTGTTADIVVTLTGLQSRCGISVYNVNGAATGAPNDSGNNGSDPLSVTGDLPANGCIIGYATSNRIITPGWATWSGITEDVDAQAESSTYYSAASDDFTAADATKTVECQSNRAGADEAMIAAYFGP